MAYSLHSETPFAGGVIEDIPGDKSVSHRALMFGALAEGETRVTGILESEDVHATQTVFTALGAHFSGEGGVRTVTGTGGVSAFTKPAAPLDFGNAGTSARLTAGILACCPFVTVMTGDASLCSRPMERVFTPLRDAGAAFVSLEGDLATEQKPSSGTLPARSLGTDKPFSINYTLPVPSAQIKSALLLAGICGGEATVIEPVLTRDHTERMSGAFGADIMIDSADDGARRVTVRKSALKGTDIAVPADPSSAAFPALLHAVTGCQNETVLKNVLVNPLRDGFFRALHHTGIAVSYRNTRDSGGDVIADIALSPYPETPRPLHIAAGDIPAMVDEIPALAAVCAFIPGVTRIEGLAELRVKESDRLAAIAAGLTACGIETEIDGDTLIIHGNAAPQGGGHVKAHLDHRIAMTFLLAGLGTKTPVTCDDVSCIATSFPNFFTLLQKSGTVLREA